MRIHDPLKQWKLSPMDLQSARPLGGLHQGQGGHLRSHPTLPRRRGSSLRGQRQEASKAHRCIDHLLHRVPYAPVPHEEITLPSRVFYPNYERHNLPPELYIPQSTERIGSPRTVNRACIHRGTYG